MITAGLTGNEAVVAGGEESDDGEGARPKVDKVDRQAELEALQQEAMAPIDEALLKVEGYDVEQMWAAVGECAAGAAQAGGSAAARRESPAAGVGSGGSVLMMGQLPRRR